MNRTFINSLAIEVLVAAIFSLAAYRGANYCMPVLLLFPCLSTVAVLFTMLLVPFELFEGKVIAIRREPGSEYLEIVLQQSWTDPMSKSVQYSDLPIWASYWTDIESNIWGDQLTCWVSSLETVRMPEEGEVIQFSRTFGQSKQAKMRIGRQKQSQNF